MMDIVERLRIQQAGGIFNLPDCHDFVGWKEAADEIERLREAIQKITDGILIAKFYADKALKEKE